MIEGFRRSLSLRLLAIFVILAAIFVLGATLAIRWVYSTDDLRELISGHLSLHVNYVRSDIGDPPRIDRAIEITKQVPVDIRIEGPGLDWASDAAFPTVAELQFSDSEIFSEEPDSWLNQLENVQFSVTDTHRYLKIEQGEYDIVVSTPPIADKSPGPNLLPVILAIGLAWLFIAYVSVRWLFKPIRSIRLGARRIGKGDFEHRISGYRNDQLGELAVDINNLASDVRGMLDAKRQLLLGISHELRSPLSRLRLALEFLENEEQKDGLCSEVDEMERIIATLLEAERLNTRHETLQRTTFDVHSLLATLIDDYFPREQDQIEIRVEQNGLSSHADEARILLLLKNLLSNAVRYSGHEAIAIEARAVSGGVEYAVADSGPGFTEEQAAHIGEPFFRGDPSRTRKTGGSGLGLYIAKLVAEAHGGYLALDAKYTAGARVFAVIPDAEEKTA